MFSVPIWKVFQSYTMSDLTLLEYYESLYNENYKGFIEMKSSLKKVSRHCLDNNIKCILVSIPDIHQSLQKYELLFINQKMNEISKELKFLLFKVLIMSSSKINFGIMPKTVAP